MQKPDWNRGFKTIGNVFYIFIGCTMMNSITIIIANRNIFGIYQTDNQWGMAVVLFLAGLVFFIIVGIFKWLTGSDHKENSSQKNG